MGDGDLRPGPQSGAEPRFDYHRRISPSLKGGHLTGPFLERAAPSEPLVRSLLGAKDQTSNKQQATSKAELGKDSGVGSAGDI